MDRADEALAAATEGIRSAQRARQGRALQLFENNRGRQLLRAGNLADAAAALEGTLQPRRRPPGPQRARRRRRCRPGPDRPAYGRSAADRTHRGHRPGDAGVRRPGVERHAAWLLALQAQAASDPAQARRWLTARGEEERLSVFPLFPLDPADDPQLVRIALDAGDRELAESATAGAERRAEISPGVPAFLASALHARGLLSGNPGLLAEAVAILQAGQRRLALASALEDLAVAEIRAGRGRPGYRRPRPGPGQLRRLRRPLGPGPGPPAPQAARDPAPRAR